MRARRSLWAAALAGAALACGGSEPSEPSGPSMAAPPARGEVDRAPEIERIRIEPGAPVDGDRVRARVTAHDPDGDRVELSYAWWVDGRTQRVEGPEFELEGASKGDRIELEVVARSGGRESEPARASATVGNRPPVLERVTIQPRGVALPGDPVTVSAEADDPDGDPVDFEYTWRVNGERVGESGDRFSTDGLSRGDRIQVRVVASDGRGESGPVDSAFVTIGNAAPAILSKPGGASEGGVFRYVVEARDPEGDRNLRYRLRQAPEGMVIDSVLGQITWRPRFGQTGVHPVEVVVEDSGGATTVQFFEVTVDELGGAPASPPAAPED